MFTWIQLEEQLLKIFKLRIVGYRMNINLIGPDLKEEDKRAIYKILENDLKKVIRMVEIEEIDVHVKVYNKQGGKRKFSAHLRASISEKVFESDDSDWDLNKVLHSAINKLKNELEKKLHSSDKGNRRRNQLDAEDRIRTYEGTKPLEPKSSPLDRSGTPAQFSKNYLI